MPDEFVPPAHAPHPPAHRPGPTLAPPVPTPRDSDLSLLGLPGTAGAVLADPRLAGRGHGAVRAAATLHLQRTLGNRAALRLVQRRASPRPAAPPPARPAVPVQRKIFIGTFPYNNPAEANAEVKAMRDDAKIRRFATNEEMRKYAAGQTDYLGYMTEGGIWVRLDEAAMGGSKFRVFGEEHGNPQDTMALVRATRTTRFRLEGFSNYPSGKTGGKNTPQGRAEVERTKVVKLGTRTHAAEHIIPKMARAFPDLENQQLARAIAARRKALQPPDPDAVKGLDEDEPAAAAGGEGYSLDKALMDTLTEALKLLKAYEGNLLGHRLKTFYLAHKDDIDQTIVQLAADTPLQDTRLIAAFIAGRLPLDAFSTLFIAATTDKFLGSASKKAAFATFKGQLNLHQEPQVTHTDLAKQQDYVRDYSMFQEIKRSKASGDLIFGIGDAHRHKLTPVLKQEGIPAFELIPFLENQKRLDEQIALGLSDDQSTLFTKLRESGGENRIFIRTPQPKRVGDQFWLIQPPETVWTLTGARIVGRDATNVKVQATAPEVILELTWQRGDQSLALATKKFDGTNKLKGVQVGAGPAPDVPAVEEGEVADGGGRQRS